MSSVKSKIYFIALTAVMITGLSGFITQDAYAFDNLDTAVTRTSATTIVVDSTDTTCTLVSGGIPADWVLSTPTIAVTAVELTTAATCIITLTTADAGDTSSTPLVTYNTEGGSNLSSSAGATADDTAMAATTDVAPPTVVSAIIATNTTIEITMTEDIIATGGAAGDFNVDGIFNGVGTVSSQSIANPVITITTLGTMQEGDQIFVDYTQPGSGLEDTGTLNELATFTNFQVINRLGYADSSDFTTDSSSNGSGCTDCEEPTLGINSNNQRIVENGFTYNGKPTNVERYFTPYPLITSTVGQQNTAIFKIYDDKGPEDITHFSFAYGLAKGQIIADSKAMIELDIDHEGTETVTVTDPENALDNIKVSTKTGNCNVYDSDIQCLIVTINHRFRASLDFNIVATDVWDMNRNSWQNYYNHGIEVTGKSLNPAKEYDGINAGHIYHLTETGKNIAVDEFGGTWSFQYGIWEQDYVMNERVADTSSVFNRNHSDFADYKELQAQNAIPQLLEYCPSCLDSFTDFDESFGYQYSNELNALDNPEIIQKMLLENERAQKIMNYLLDPVKYR